MNDTPGIRRPLQQCIDCNQPAQPTNPRCTTHQQAHNQAHNQDRSHYHTPAWQRQRKRIIQRDYNQCTLCGSIPPTFHVHHIHHNATNQNTPDHQLITLCPTCHMKLEREHQTNTPGHMHQALQQHLQHSPHH